MNLDISLLQKLISTPSPFPGELGVERILYHELNSLGFSVERQFVRDDRNNLLAQRGDNSRILFYGHMDTVSTNLALWESSPFSLKEEGDRLYGLGAYDMKGGLLSVISALRITGAPCKVLFAVDEENISEGAWSALTRKDFFEGIDLIISAEPNFGHGLNGITTARTGRVIFELVEEGRAAHIADYAKGVDAINQLVQDMQAIYEHRESLVVDSKTVLQVRKIDAESVGMSVPSNAIAEIEVLLGEKDSISKIRDSLDEITVGKISLKPRPTPYLTGYSFPSFPYQEVIRDIIHENTKQTMKIVSRSSVGDDNVLATLGKPVITWGPDGGNAHSPNEYVSKSSLQTLTKMYAELLEKSG